MFINVTLHRIGIQSYSYKTNDLGVSLFVVSRVYVLSVLGHLLVNFYASLMKGISKTFAHIERLQYPQIKILWVPFPFDLNISFFFNLIASTHYFSIYVILAKIRLSILTLIKPQPQEILLQTWYNGNGHQMSTNKSKAMLRNKFILEFLQHILLANELQCYRTEIRWLFKNPLVFWKITSYLRDTS